MERRLKIDFVSDVTCPWCAIGLANLERAIDRLQGQVEVELRFQPFELNPDIPPEGEALADYAARKYGASAEELGQRQRLVRQRAAAAGLQFPERTRVWNTFDAHRLLHWAGIEGRQRELKHALLDAYHARGENLGAADVVLSAAAAVGLDVDRARSVIESDRYADEVRARVEHWRRLGIDSVPSIVVDGRYLIQGGQPVEVFEQTLRRVAAEAAAT